jgi:hypothetical protein
MKIKELRQAGEAMGREAISIYVIDLINNFDGSYKGSIELCGQLSVMAKVCSYDDYWNEQVCRGVAKAERSIQMLMEPRK